MIAGEERAAERGGAAVDEIVKRAVLGRQKASGVPDRVRRFRDADNIRERRHGPLECERVKTCVWFLLLQGERYACHQIVDGRERFVVERAGEMRIDRCGLRTRMPEILLNEPKIDAGFEQMCGVTVAERVDMRLLVNATLFDGAIESALETRARDWPYRRIIERRDMAPGAGGKEPERISVRRPEGAQQPKCGVGERNESILAALAVHMDHHAGAVDVRDLQSNAFGEAKAAGVHRGETDAIDRNADVVECAPHFLAAQDDRKLLLALWAHDGKHRPLESERVLVKEADATDGDEEGAARYLSFDAQVEQVLSDLLFREGLGRRMIVGCQLGDGPGVGLDGAFGVAAQLEVLDHAFAERFHDVLSC